MFISYLTRWSLVYAERYCFSHKHELLDSMIDIYVEITIWSTVTFLVSDYNDYKGKVCRRMNITPCNATVLDDKTNQSMMKIAEDGNSQTCEVETLREMDILSSKKMS